MRESPGTVNSSRRKEESAFTHMFKGLNIFQYAKAMRESLMRFGEQRIKKHDHLLQGENEIYLGLIQGKQGHLGNSDKNV